MTTLTMQEHAEQLAKAFDVRLIVHSALKPHEACAIPHLRVVLAAPIVEHLTYAVVLHELGHLVAPVGALTDRPRTAKVQQAEEDAAWHWARHHALEWTPEMEALARYAEATYQTPEPVAPRQAPVAPPPAPVAPKPKQPERIDWTKWERRTK